VPHRDALELQGAEEGLKFQEFLTSALEGDKRSALRFGVENLHLLT